MSWEEGKLSDYIKFNYGKGLPERNRKGGCIPVYGSGGEVGRHNKPLITGPGIIIGRKGTIGSVYWESRDFYPIDTTYYITIEEERVLKRFAYYLLKSLPLSEMNTDAAVPGLNRDNAHRIDVRLPDIKIQQSIVDVLENYDDLIKNNKRRIELLEESARQLYKEWFVRFRFPGHEHVKIIDGVPEGWEAKVFEEVAEVRNGFAFKSEDYSSEGMPVIRTRDFSATRYVFRTEDIRIPEYMLEKYKKYQLKRLDFLLIMVGASLGKYGIVTEKDLPALQNQNMWAIYTKNDEEFPQVYLIEMMQELILKFLSYRVGAAREFFRKDFVKKQQIIVPPNSLLNDFVETTGGIYKQIETLLLQNEKLIKARDLLLPKLMSGDIAV